MTYVVESLLVPNDPVATTSKLQLFGCEDRLALITDFVVTLLIATVVTLVVLKQYYGIDLKWANAFGTLGKWPTYALIGTGTGIVLVDITQIIVNTARYIGELKESINQAANSNALEELKAQHKDEKENLQKQVETQASHIIELEDKVLTATIDKDTAVEEALKAQRENIEKLVKERDEVSSKLAILSGEKATVEVERSSVLAEKNLKEKELLKAKQDLEEKEGALVAQAKDLAEKAEEARLKQEGLEAEIVRLKGDLSATGDAGKRVVELEETLRKHEESGALETKVVKLEGERHEKVEALKQLEAKLASTKEENNRLEQAGLEIKQLLEEAVRSADEEKRKLTASIDDLKAKEHDQQVILGRQQAEKEELDKAYEAVQKRIAEATKNEESFIERARVAHDKLVQLEAEIGEIEKQKAVSTPPAGENLEGAGTAEVETEADPLLDLPATPTGALKSKEEGIQTPATPAPATTEPAKSEGAPATASEPEGVTTPAPTPSEAKAVQPEGKTTTTPAPTTQDAGTEVHEDEGTNGSFQPLLETATTTYILDLAKEAGYDLRTVPQLSTEAYSVVKETAGSSTAVSGLLTHFADLLTKEGILFKVDQVELLKNELDKAQKEYVSTFTTTTEQFDFKAEADLNDYYESLVKSIKAGDEQEMKANMALLAIAYDIAASMKPASGEKEEEAVQPHEGETTTETSEAGKADPASEAKKAPEENRERLEAICSLRTELFVYDVRNMKWSNVLTEDPQPAEETGVLQKLVGALPTMGSPKQLTFKEIVEKVVLDSGKKLVELNQLVETLKENAKNIEEAISAGKTIDDWNAVEAPSNELKGYLEKIADQLNNKGKIQDFFK